MAALPQSTLASPVGGPLDPPLVRVRAESKDQEKGLCATIQNAVLEEWGQGSACNTSRNGEDRTRIRLERLGKEGTRLSIFPPDGDATRPTELTWRISRTTPEQEAREIRKLIRQHGEFRRDEARIRATALNMGLSESETVARTPRGDYIETATGRVISFDEAYTAFLNERPKNKHYLRALVEIAAVLGAGSVWYWSDVEFNAVDWEYQFNADSFADRTYRLEGIRLDNNHWQTNTVMHPLAGWAYYAAARSNNLSPMESFLLSFAGSALWEYFGEFKEIVSLNDMIFTPVAGSVIGEVFHQFAHFFRTSADNPVNRVLGVIFGAPETLNSWLSNESAARSASVDRYGFRNDIWHRFDLFAGAGAATAKGDLAGYDSAIIELGFDGEIAGIPGHGQPGSVASGLDTTAFSRLLIRSTIGEDGLHDFLLGFKAAFAGYYMKDIVRDTEGDLNGYSFFIGPASAFELSHHRSGHVNDLVGIANVLGPSMDVVLYKNGLRLRATLDVYGDFAAVRSLAVEPYALANDISGAKAVLADKRYHYLFGVTTNARMTASYGDFEVGVEGRFHGLSSIEGADRREKELTGDIHGTETVAEVTAWVAYELPLDATWLTARYTGRYRESSLDGTVVKETEHRVLGSVLMRF